MNSALIQERNRLLRPLQDGTFYIDEKQAIDRKNKDGLTKHRNKITHLKNKTITSLLEEELKEVVTLAKLTDKQLVVFNFWFYDNLSVFEMHLKLSISVESVYSHLYSSFRKIKRAHEHCKLTGLEEVYKELTNG